MSRPGPSDLRPPEERDDAGPLRHLTTRRKFLLAGVLAGTGVAGLADALDNDGALADLWAGWAALGQAYNVAGNLWVGPDSAKADVTASSGRMYMATDKQIDYYGDGGTWVEYGYGTAANPGPPVYTEAVTADDLDTKGRPFYSVKGFGATGDGSTDDTSAINSAISQVKSDGGGYLYFPPGTYRITSAISTIDFDNVTIGGIRGASIIELEDTDLDVTGGFPMLDIAGSSGDLLKGVVVENLTLDYRKSAHSGTASSGNDIIDGQYLDSAVFRNIDLLNSSYDGIDLDDCQDTTIAFCKADSCDGYGYHTSENTVRNRVLACQGIDCGVAQNRGAFDLFTSASDSYYIGLIAIDGHRGINIQGDNANVWGLYVKDTASFGIRTTGNNHNIDAATVVDCGADVTASVVIFSTDTAVSKVRVELPNITSSTHNGFTVSTNGDTRLIHCYSEDAPDNGFQLNEPATLIECEAKNNGTHGAEFEKGGNRVMGGKYSSNSNNGLVFRDADDVITGDPDISGNSGGDIIAGTRTKWDGVIAGGPIGGTDLSSTSGQVDNDLGVHDGTGTLPDNVYCLWDGSNWRPLSPVTFTYTGDGTATQTVAADFQFETVQIEEADNPDIELLRRGDTRVVLSGSSMPGSFSINSDGGFDVGNGTGDQDPNTDTETYNVWAA